MRCGDVDLQEGLRRHATCPSLLPFAGTPGRAGSAPNRPGSGEPGHGAVFWATGPKRRTVGLPLTARPYCWCKPTILSVRTLLSHPGAWRHSLARKDIVAIR